MTTTHDNCSPAPRNPDASTPRARPPQPLATPLFVAALLSATFVLLRDDLAAGLPDSQAIPFAVYPGFVATYSSVSLLSDTTLMLLFCVSASILIFTGLLVAYFAASRADVVWGATAAASLVLAADLQRLIAPPLAEGTIRSLLTARAGVLTWDLQRVTVGALLVLLGILIGYGVRRAARRHERAASHTKAPPAVGCFRPLFAVLATFLLCRATFVCTRDVSGVLDAPSSFATQPWRFLTHTAASPELALVATTGLLALGCAVRVAAHWRRPAPVVSLFGAATALVILDVTLSSASLHCTTGDPGTIPALLLAVALIVLASLLARLAAPTSLRALRRLLRLRLPDSV